MPEVTTTAVLLLAEGLLLVPLWAATRCGIAAWRQLRRPEVNSSAPQPRSGPALRPPSADG